MGVLNLGWTFIWEWYIPIGYFFLNSMVALPLLDPKVGLRKT
jgi:hypothetical protein